MSDAGPASEFGGKTNAMGIQPFPHVPTVNERLRAVYLTGDELETGTLPVQPEREAFNGLLPEAEQRAIAEEAGLLEHGQVWEELTGGNS